MPMMNSGSTRSDPRRWLALALLGTAFFMVVLDSTIVYVALPSIDEALGFWDGGLQWVMSAYLLTFGGLLLLGGRSADLLGRRRMFMIGVGLFAAASLVCGFAWSDQVLVAARVVQGVAAAIMAPTALSLLMTVFEEGPERNRALGIWGGIGGVGATSGLLIGGPVTEGLGWEWVFLINVPVALGVLALCPMLLPESRASGGHRVYDVAGAVTITSALVLLVFAVSEALPMPDGRALRRSAPCSPQPSSWPGFCASRGAPWRRWCHCASSARGLWSAATSSCSLPAPRSTGC
jgi:MFS family permease